jgi:carboxyl-terminal processing protease
MKMDSAAFSVLAVARRGPSEEAGLRTGDRIVAVNGVSAQRLGGRDLDAAVRAPTGSRLTLSIERGTEHREIVVALRDLI